MEPPTVERYPHVVSELYSQTPPQTLVGDTGSEAKHSNISRVAQSIRPRRKSSNTEIAATAVKAATQRTAEFSKKYPKVFALHGLLFAVLLTHCVPTTEVWKLDERWTNFPGLSILYGLLRITRLALRCLAFTVCALRFVYRSKASDAGGAFDRTVETVFTTIWPTERRACLALWLYCISRALKLLKLTMEAYVLHSEHFDICDGVSLAQGLCSRSGWLVGLVLGARYLNNLEITEEGSTGGPAGVDSSSSSKHQAALHPRLRRMLQSSAFRAHARLTAIAWVVTSLAECHLLFHWEAGVAENIHELDALRFTQDFFKKYSPHFREWSFARVVVGSWREPFYFMMLWPRCCALSMMLATGVVSFQSAHYRVPWLRPLASHLLLGAASYIFLTSAHHLQFLILCLIVSWECWGLQDQCEAFQDNFGNLSSAERVHQHADLGRVVERASNRLQSIIMYLVSERVVHMAVDVALWRCESMPFTLLHYTFRHLVRISGVALVIWRIGRLNASIYDDLTGKVQWELAGCHHRYAGLDDDAFKRKRWELKDWVQYLQHNSSGRRKYCLRVCSFQCCLRAHTVAFWAVSFVLFPVAKKVLALLPTGSGLL